MKRRIEELLKNTERTEGIDHVIQLACEYDNEVSTIVSRIVETSRSIESSIESNSWMDAYAKVIMDMAYQLERVLDVPYRGIQTETPKAGVF